MKIKYEHNFTLREDPKGTPPRDTSSKARKAYTDALEKEGFHPYAAGPRGTIRKLPHSARVGEFTDDDAARDAIRKAEAAAKAADPGKFFVEASTLTHYEALRTIGDPFTPPPAPAPTPATRAAKHVETLRRLNLGKKE